MARASLVERVRSGEIVLEAVDRVVALRWDAARRAAASTTGTVAQRVEQLTRSFAKELAAVGAATGAAAAVPAIGTGASLSASVAEFGWFTARAADLILAIAAVHGHTTPTVEERRAWVLSVLLMGKRAAKGFRDLADELGKGDARRSSQTVTTELHRRISRDLRHRLLARYGTRRGMIALGTALPLGVGAFVGGRANHALTRTIARDADRLFRELPLPDQAVPRGTTHSLAAPPAREISSKSAS